MFIHTEDGDISCVKAMGKWMCFKGSIPGGKKPTGPPDPQRLIEEMATPQYVGTRVVAGVECYCYKISKSTQAGEEETTTCVSSDGLPLYIESKLYTNGNVKFEMIMEAQSFETQVSDDEFTPPAKPR